MTTHTASLAAPVPFSGIQPGTRPRFSRGQLVEGVTHLTATTFETGGEWGAVVVPTLCSRRLIPGTVYGADVTPRFVDEWHRIGRTHETHLCGRCMAAMLPGTIRACTDCLAPLGDDGTDGTDGAGGNVCPNGTKYRLGHRPGRLVPAA